MTYSVRNSYEFPIGAGPFTITATVAGNLLAVLAWHSGGPNLATVTDGSSTYNAAGADVGSTFCGNGYWAKNIAAGVTSLSASWSGGTPASGRVWVVELAGLDTVSPFLGGNGQPQAAPGGSTGAVTTGLTINVSLQPAAVVGFCADYQSGTITLVAGETQLQQSSFGTLGHYRTLSVGGQAFAGTTNFGSDGHISFGMAFAEPGASGALIEGMGAGTSPGVSSPC